MTDNKINGSNKPAQNFQLTRATIEALEAKDRGNDALVARLYGLEHERIALLETANLLSKNGLALQERNDNQRKYIQVQDGEISGLHQRLRILEGCNEVQKNTIKHMRKVIDEAATSPVTCEDADMAYATQGPTQDFGPSRAETRERLERNYSRHSAEGHAEVLRAAQAEPDEAIHRMLKAVHELVASFGIPNELIRVQFINGGVHVDRVPEREYRKDGYAGYDPLGTIPRAG